MPFPHFFATGERHSPTSGRPGGGTLIVHSVVWTFLSPFLVIVFIQNFTRSRILWLKYTIFSFGWGFTPKPHWRSLRCSPRCPSQLGRGTCHPQTPPPQCVRHLARLLQFLHFFFHDLCASCCCGCSTRSCVWSWTRVVYRSRCIYLCLTAMPNDDATMQPGWNADAIVCHGGMVYLTRRCWWLDQRLVIFC